MINQYDTIYIAIDVDISYRNGWIDIERDVY